MAPDRPERLPRGGVGVRLAAMDFVAEGEPLGYMVQDLY